MSEERQAKGSTFIAYGAGVLVFLTPLNMWGLQTLTAPGAGVLASVAGGCAALAPFVGIGLIAKGVSRRREEAEEREERASRAAEEGRRRGIREEREKEARLERASKRRDRELDRAEREVDLALRSGKKAFRPSSPDDAGGEKQRPKGQNLN